MQILNVNRAVAQEVLINGRKVLTIILAACAKPIAALNLKHGKRGSLTASTQPGSCSRSPIQSWASSMPSTVRFSPIAPGGSGSCHKLTPA